MRYVFDNCLSYRLANMLAALEVNAFALRALFPESIPDIDLFAQLTADDVLITYDHRQKTREAESRAIREAGITVIWLGPFWRKKIWWEQAKWLIHRWPNIEGFTTNVVPGTCAEIRENGRAMPFPIR